MKIHTQMKKNPLALRATLTDSLINIDSFSSNQYQLSLTVVLTNLSLTDSDKTDSH